jgi:hypothetical protein
VAADRCHAIMDIEEKLICLVQKYPCLDDAATDGRDGRYGADCRYASAFCRARLDVATPVPIRRDAG